MTRERLNQIRKDVDFDPSSAESYTDELIRAVDQYIRDSHAQSGALREARAEVERLREVVREVHALIDGATMLALPEAVQMLREIHKVTKGMVE